MAKTDDLIIVSKKEQQKVIDALTKAKEVIDAAVALIGGGEAPEKKARKPRATKAEMSARAEQTPAGEPGDFDDKPKTTSAPIDAAIKKAATASTPKPLPAPKAQGQVTVGKFGKAPAMPQKSKGNGAMPRMPGH